MQATLSPRELGEAIGVSESSLKRWADDGRLKVARTAGGHRRIAVDEAVRFIRQAGLPVVRPELLGLSDMATVAISGLAARPLDETLATALIDGRPGDVRGLVASAYLGGVSVAALCDGPLAAAMRHVGELWLHDRIGIAVEHRAANLCAAALHQLHALLPAPKPDAPVAIGGAPTDDIYMLPSLMAATVLLAEGWSPINLGPDMPLDVLSQAVKDHGAHLVWLSVSVDQAARTVSRPLAPLASQLASEGVALVVGGRATRELGQVPNTTHIFDSMHEFAAFARGLRVAAMTAPPAPGTATVPSSTPQAAPGGAPRTAP